MRKLDAILDVPPPETGEDLTLEPIKSPLKHPESTESASWARDGVILGSEVKTYDIDVGPNDTHVEIRIQQTSNHISHR